MNGPITNRPAAPLPMSFAPTPAAMPDVTTFQPLPAHDLVGPPQLPVDANGALPGVIAPPTSPGMPIGTPSSASSAPGAQIIALAEKLLGQPLPDQVKQQVTMESGLMSPTTVIRNLLTQPGIASSLATRALDIVKKGGISGLVSSYLKSKAPTFIKTAQSFFKPGGFMEKLKGLKESFNVPSLSKITAGLAGLFGPKPTATPQPAAT